jgi:hypothetical protein
VISNQASQLIIVVIMHLLKMLWQTRVIPSSLGTAKEMTKLRVLMSPDIVSGTTAPNSWPDRHSILAKASSSTRGLKSEATAEQRVLLVALVETLQSFTWCSCTCDDEKDFGISQTCWLADSRASNVMS